VAALLSVLVLSFNGCTTPIRADRTTARAAYRELTKTALDGQCSHDARTVLHRHDLEDQFRKSPVECLRRLHEQACLDDRGDLLYALAELNYLHGERLTRSVKAGDVRAARDFHLAAAIYAWFFLTGQGSAASPDPFDRRFRVACDLYNRAVALGFAEGTRPHTVVRWSRGARALVPGTVRIECREPAGDWTLNDIEKFLPADEYILRGLTVRDRQSGLGAPLIGVGKTIEPRRYGRRVPATLVLRAGGDARAWSAGELVVSLEVYSTYESDSIELDGRTIPLETDTTAPLAYSLNDTTVWRLGTVQFFSPEERIRTDIYPTQPYRPGRIPVVFVHGTLSSPAWWAEMWNTLRADRSLRERCQFWYYLYNTGNPVTYSAANLRDAIERTVRRFDPEGRDPALRQMVLVGHSQGGLLAKLTAVETGDRLWRAVSDQPFDSLALRAGDREPLRRNYFFNPLPSVKRVVFISTPHRGTDLATSFVGSVARRFVRLPAEVVRMSRSLVSTAHAPAVPGKVRRTVPTSLDSMSPRNKVLLALADIPLAPGVTGHSIIAVKGTKPVETGGDGVVEYSSAHLEGVASELIVRCGHTCQDKPETIEEVRRILLEHLAACGLGSDRPGLGHSLQKRPELGELVGVDQVNPGGLMDAPDGLDIRTAPEADAPALRVGALDKVSQPLRLPGRHLPLAAPGEAGAPVLADPGNEARARRSIQVRQASVDGGPAAGQAGER